MRSRASAETAESRAYAGGPACGGRLTRTAASWAYAFRPLRDPGLRAPTDRLAAGAIATRRPEGVHHRQNEADQPDDEDDRSGGLNVDPADVSGYRPLQDRADGDQEDRRPDRHCAALPRICLPLGSNARRTTLAPTTRRHGSAGPRALQAARAPSSADAGATPPLWRRSRSFVTSRARWPIRAEMAGQGRGLRVSYRLKTWRERSGPGQENKLLSTGVGRADRRHSDRATGDGGETRRNRATFAGARPSSPRPVAVAGAGRPATRARNWPVRGV
jgi:hypothetical protein